MNKAISTAVIIIIVFTISSCANMFGPNLTYLKKNKSVDFEKTENVSVFFDKAIAKEPSTVLPPDLEHILIAKVQVVIDPPLPNARQNGFYAPLRKSTYSTIDFKEAYSDLLDRLTSEAKSIGADFIVINSVGTVREQRVDSVYMTLGKKVSHGPWFNLPMMKATFLKEKQ